MFRPSEAICHWSQYVVDTLKMIIRIAAKAQTTAVITLIMTELRPNGQNMRYILRLTPTWKCYLNLSRSTTPKTRGNYGWFACVWDPWVATRGTRAYSRWLCLSPFSPHSHWNSSKLLLILFLLFSMFRRIKERAIKWSWILHKMRFAFERN